MIFTIYAPRIHLASCTKVILIPDTMGTGYKKLSITQVLNVLFPSIQLRPVILPSRKVFIFYQKIIPYSPKAQK